jgi:hypothetical protein
VEGKRLDRYRLVVDEEEASRVGGLRYVKNSHGEARMRATLHVIGQLERSAVQIDEGRADRQA